MEGTRARQGPLFETLKLGVAAAAEGQSGESRLRGTQGDASSPAVREPEPGSSTRLVSHGHPGVRPPGHSRRPLRVQAGCKARLLLPLRPPPFSPKRHEQPVPSKRPSSGSHLRICELLPQADHPRLKGRVPSHTSLHTRTAVIGLAQRLSSPPHPQRPPCLK